MMEFFKWFVKGFEAIGNEIDTVTFPIAGLSVSLLDIMIGFVCFGIVLTVFWKGAHS